MHRKITARSVCLRIKPIEIQIYKTCRVKKIEKRKNNQFTIVFRVFKIHLRNSVIFSCNESKTVRFSHRKRERYYGLLLTYID